MYVECQHTADKSELLLIFTITLLLTEAGVEGQAVERGREEGEGTS